MIPRLLQRPTPPGLLECKECGGHQTINVIEGARLKNGRLTGGKVLHRLICGHCYAVGKVSSMRAEPA